MADNQTVSEGDLQSLAVKLAEFTRTLTPGEQTALMEQLKQAPAADDDVQGYQYNFLYERIAEAHRADLVREAEQARLAASAQPPRQPGMVRVAIGRMGTVLVDVGTRMKRVEMPQGTVTRPA